ncbi:GAF domain-containing protein [Thalassotalea euphylliae]|uniref:GAF domain-containing protein n=1 Tax=Thalassotalea euphylliae TaxID=1655234 RepID=A0A3E0ULD8_9GAMM|nr:GAF domain-containing protein [Thalassotalea euphylliae]REL37095.1 hypothetical protein DXX92_18225 [Thalassotalea euphylliae]
MNKLQFGFTGESEVLNQFSNKIGQWWYIFFAAAGSALISICASFAAGFDFSTKLEATIGFWPCLWLFIWNPWLGILLGVLAILYGGKGTFNDLENLNDINAKLKKENTNIPELKNQINSISEDSESLQNQLSDLQVKLVETWLKGSSRQWKLSTQERVSIYYYVDNHFYLLARHSQNPIYAEQHRQKFSRNQGVISKAWQHKICVDIENCPLYKDDPEGYKAYMQEHYQYDSEKIDNLAMKSSRFVAISIIDADKHIGVIVIESVRADFFKSQKVSQIKRYCTEYQSYMVDFVKGAIQYDKSAKVGQNHNLHVDQDFMESLTKGGKHE